MQETRNTFDALEWKCPAKRPLTYSGDCCFGLFGCGANTEIAIKMTLCSHIFLYLTFIFNVYCSMRSTVAISSWRWNKIGKIGDNVDRDISLISGNAPENLGRMFLFTLRDVALDWVVCEANRVWRCALWMQWSATVMVAVTLSSLRERFLTIQITSQKSPFSFFLSRCWHANCKA
jgi:hypothetical protein